MGLWHNIKVKLGLEDEYDDEYYEDEEYSGDDYDDEDEGAVPRHVGYESPYGSGAGVGAVRRIDRSASYERERSQLRSVPAGPSAAPGAAPQVKMHIVEPKSFDEAKALADRFKQGTPIILNLTMTKPDVAKRLIDFAGGLTYGLDGGLQKVSDKVFMLSPHNVEVSDADRRRLQSTGLFSTPD